MTLTASYFKAIIFITVLFLSSVFFGSLSSLTYYSLFFLEKPTRNKWAHFFASQWAKIIVNLTPGWNVLVEGKNNIPTDKKFILVANHESMTDIFVMYFSGLQFRWLSKASVFKIPFIGQAMYASGYIPIERGNKDSHKHALERSAEVIRTGIPMFYFPEGTRSRGGVLKKFKTGAFKLANDTGASIVPVCIQGTRDLLLKGSILPGNANVTIRFLPPIVSQANEDLDEFACRTRLIIANEKNIKNNTSL